MENYKNEARYFEAKKRVDKIKGFYIHAIVYALVNLLLLFLIYSGSYVASDFWRFGTFFTPFFWGIGLLSHAIGVFGPNISFFKDWEKRKMKEFMQEEERNKTNKWS